MQRIIEQLQQLGFSQYEAQAYLALLKENPANGYELAKNSGIPRPNIYPVLQKLEDRGAILRLTSPDGIRYTPLPIQELISKLKHHYQEVIDATSQALSEAAAPFQAGIYFEFSWLPDPAGSRPQDAGSGSTSPAPDRLAGRSQANRRIVTASPGSRRPFDHIVLERLPSPLFLLPGRNFPLPPGRCRE